MCESDGDRPALDEAGAVAADTPLTILELGGGDGDCARDAPDYIVERAAAASAVDGENQQTPKTIPTEGGAP